MIFKSYSYMITKKIAATLLFAISIFSAYAQFAEENGSTDFNFSGRYLLEGIEEYQPIHYDSPEYLGGGDILLNLDVQTPSAQFVTWGSGFDGTYIWIASGGVVGSLEPNTLIKMTLEGEVVEVYFYNQLDNR